MFIGSCIQVNYTLIMLIKRLHVVFYKQLHYLALAAIEPQSSERMLTGLLFFHYFSKAEKYFHPQMRLLRIFEPQKLLSSCLFTLANLSPKAKQLAKQLNCL